MGTKYRYLSEKLGAAVQILMLPSDETRAIASALHEVSLVCGRIQIVEDEHAEQLRRSLLETIESVPGSWEAFAQSMSRDQKNDFAASVWKLSVWADRAFWAGPES